MTFGSLFAGIGGMDLGLERAGMECRWQVDIDPFARRVLEKHWPHVRRWDDVRTFPPGGEHGRRDWRVDLICGGDPCQENSRARIARGTVQPSLGDQFLRVVDAIRPRLVLRENPTESRPDAPWPWWRFRSELESLGYVVLPFRLRACCLGLDHQRDRLFLLANLPDADGQLLRLLRRREALEATGALQGEASERQRVRADAGPVLCAERDRPDARARRAADGISRRLDGARLKAIGNAVSPVMAEWIGLRILEADAPGDGRNELTTHRRP